MLRRDPAAAFWLSLMVASAVGVGLALVLFASSLARAHDWYPLECCSEKDCEPMEALTMRRDGDAEVWILPDGERVPFAVARPSHDGRFHWCRYVYEGGQRSGVIKPFGRPVCLFVPEADG